MTTHLLTPNGRRVTSEAAGVSLDTVTGRRTYAFPLFDGEVLVDYVLVACDGDEAEAFAQLAELYRHVPAVR